jgi:diaminopimelate decarboxylase
MEQETPHFIFKEKVLEKNYKEFERLCEEHIGKYVIAYSIKTNGFGALINKLHELGSNFEVASEEEIMKTPVKSKVFNGSCKTEEELQMAIDGRFLINVDSKSEIDRMASLMDGKEFKISLRVALNQGKFGFAENRLIEIIDYCKDKNLKVIGLSFHVGTQKALRDFDDHLKGVKRVVNSVINFTNLRYVDIGGGFPDKYQMKNLRVKLEDFFRLINFNLVEPFKDKSFTIVLEPGRCLVSDAFDLVTRVCVIKENFTRNYAILDAGINLLSKITLAQYRFEKIENTNKNIKSEVIIKKDGVKVDSDGNVENIGGITREMVADTIGDQSLNSGSGKKDYILAGPLLFGNDVIGKFNGNLKEGDLMRVSNVGAYCFNLAWEISYRKPRVLIE